MTRRSVLCECCVKLWEEKEKKQEVEKTKDNQQETRNVQGHDQMVVESSQSG